MNIYILIGLPRSGKTTWANNFVDNLSDYKLLSYGLIDELISAHNGIRIRTKIVKELADAIEKNVENIIIDVDSNLNNYNRIGYLEVVKAAKKYFNFDIKCTAVNFLTSFDTCLERDSADTRYQYTEVLLRKIGELFSYGEKAEGFDDIIEI